MNGNPQRPFAALVNLGIGIQFARAAGPAVNAATARGLFGLA